MRNDQRRSIACRAGVVASLVVGSQIAATAVFAQEAGPSIREQLQETGGFERIIVTPYEPLMLADLITRAKLVVEASVSSSESYVDASGLDVYTDYTVTVHAVLKNRERSLLREGNVITIRRPSGVIVLDGRAVEVRENEFPAFKTDEHYFLFLTRGPREMAYRVFGGNQGAFSASETVVVPLAPTFDQRAPSFVSRTDFLGEVRALLKFTEN